MLQSLRDTMLSRSELGPCWQLPEHQASLHHSAFAAAVLSAYSLLPPLPPLAHSASSSDTQFRSIQLQSKPGPYLQLHRIEAVHCLSEDQLPNGKCQVPHGTRGLQERDLGVDPLALPLPLPLSPSCTFVATFPDFFPLAFRVCSGMIWF